MSEAICLHIGQAGARIGTAVWELLAIEQGIDTQSACGVPLKGTDTNLRAHWHETEKGSYLPRALFFDLEPDALDQIKANSNLFPRDLLIRGKEGGGGIYARGYCSIGREYIDIVLDRFRKLAEQCNYLQKILLFRSLCGGTGSGFGSLLLERLKEEYGKKPRFEWTVFPDCDEKSTRVGVPAPIGNGVISAYNTVLSLEAMDEHSDICQVLQNGRIYDICRSKLGIAEPTYRDINRVIAHVFAAQTSELRQVSHLNVGLEEFSCSGLVPYPSIHYLIPSIAPLQKNPSQGEPTVEELVTTVLDKSNALASCDIAAEKLMAAMMKFRGNVVPKEITKALLMVKERKLVNFVDWAPAGIKCGVQNNPELWIGSDENDIRTITTIPRSLVMTSNSLGVGGIFAKIGEQFDKLYSKRAYVHWYERDGMAETEMLRSREIWQQRILDYEEIGAEEEELPV